MSERRVPYGDYDTRERCYCCNRVLWEDGCQAFAAHGHCCTDCAMIGADLLASVVSAIGAVSKLKADGREREQERKRRGEEKDGSEAEEERKL